MGLFSIAKAMYYYFKTQYNRSTYCDHFWLIWQLSIKNSLPFGLKNQLVKYGFGKLETLLAIKERKTDVG